MTELPQAFVFNCNYNGLSLIQSLGRRGVGVSALDSRRSIGTYSRYARYHRCPDPCLDERGFVDALLAHGRGMDCKPVLFPTNDHWAEALSRNLPELSEHFSCCVSGYETVSLLLDKWRFGLWAQEEGLPAPRVWSPDTFRDAPDRVFPVAVKATGRRRAGLGEAGAAWSRAADRLRFRVCADEAALNVVLEEARREEVPVFLQQVISGRSDAMRSIGLYARDGLIHGLVYGRKLRGFPPACGDCIVGLAEPVPDWALSLARNVCAQLRYTGMAELEVMEDAKSGERFLIEINPRSWSWTGVAAPAGVDLAWIAYQDLAMGKTPQEMVMGCADGQPVYYAKALEDIQNTLLWYRFTEADDWVLSPARWWKTFSGRKGVFAEFSRDDPMVALMSTSRAGRQFLGQLRRALRKGTLTP